jgi:hypothetical protein
MCTSGFRLLLYPRYDPIGLKDFLDIKITIPGISTANPKAIAPARTTAPMLTLAIAPWAISIDFFTGIVIKGTLNANSIYIKTSKVNDFENMTYLDLR